ncbi:helix-hairpin-helix domain-containing protein [Anaerosalibacter sp. Marseille-P3206]|uniref:helix-hairpin-helix domain-containing protein n=1 Tax=Anaerosalibacter sp. Marseille-P3206 TaxID=1871005 RepID=UPI0009F8598A|nr:helix-hairpin-helix domain-containing protein [Anaerosalibacter sp. Marseille-P3206]
MIIFTKRQQIVILLLVVIVILITSISIYKKNVRFDDEINKLSSIDENELLNNSNNDSKELEEDNVEENNGIIMVHISGQVYKPGLIELENGSRVIDAVNKAGGLKSEADIDRINLAKKVVDEEKIYIPKIGEEITGIDANTTTSSSECSTSKDTDKININTCSKEELMSLSGIGEVLATRIIEYRETNTFKSIDDIMNVSGIGNKKFENIKDYITVN